MVDDRSENQQVAAVQASMIMAGQPMDDRDIADVRRIFREEVTADQSCLDYLEAEGLGDTPRAVELRERITAHRNAHTRTKHRVAISGAVRSTRRRHSRDRGTASA